MEIVFGKWLSSFNFVFSNQGSSKLIVIVIYSTTIDSSNYKYHIIYVRIHSMVIFVLGVKTA
jgi:hypothetical protein